MSERPIIFDGVSMRALLEIVSIRPERLHAITGADVVAEGVINANWRKHCSLLGAQWWRSAFASRWDLLNGKPKKGKPDVSFHANPWVWCIEFEPKRKPNDR